MRAAGIVVAETLAVVREAVRPGVTTRELDALAEEEIRARGGEPSFLGYHGFPATLCTSLNDEVVHGIPSDRVLREGDLLSVDCGAIVDGWHGDAAFTVPVGAASSVSAEVRQLLRVTEEALWAGLSAARPGGRLYDIGAAVEAWVAGRYAILADYTGHGIGTRLHEDPHVPNHRMRSRGPQLQPGAVLAVEPMLVLGSPYSEVLADGWTVRTLDGAWSAHFEHTVAVTVEGPWVLTALDGGAQRLRSAAG